MDRLEVTEYNPGDVHVLRVHGELDLGTVPSLCRRMSRLRERGARPIAVIDLSELEFCDSPGLRALLGEAREAECCGGRMRVVAPASGVARRLFDVCGVHELIDVDPDCPTAVRRLKQAA
jgi:anti-anti-sigma factor